MKKIFICTFIFIIAIYIFPQQLNVNRNKSILQKLEDDAMILAEDAGLFFTSPLRFTANDWLYAAGITGGTILLFNTDNAVKKSVGRKTILSLNKDFWDLPTTYGIVTYGNLFSLALYSAGLFSGEDNLRLTGRMLFETLSLSGITVMAFRYIAGRIRPYYEEGPWKFYWFETSNEIQSFPSGHTVVAFALSTVLADRIDNIFAHVGFFGLASLTAFSRVYNNQHWFSDVAAGALLGIGTGLFVIQKESERQNKKDDGLSFKITPSFNGINFRLDF